jgi:hypothetical protein
MADIVGLETLAPVQNGESNQQAAAESARYSRTGDMLKNRMSYMVKGAGYVGTGNQALTDPGQILTKAHQATMELRTETNRGFTRKADVIKGLNPQFLSQFGNLKTALTAPSVNESLQQIVTAIGNPDLTRSFTAGNLGRFCHAA